MFDFDSIARGDELRDRDGSRYQVIQKHPRWGRRGELLTILRRHDEIAFMLDRSELQAGGFVKCNDAAKIN